MAARRRRAMHVHAERLEGRVLLAASLLKDINTATDSSSPFHFTSAGSIAYFVTGNLWKTDGTSAGTQIVASGPSNPYELTLLNGKLYFVANDAKFQNAVYVTDGTSTGTMAIAPLDANGQYAAGASPDLTAANGKLFFVAHVTPDNPAGLWVTDGTPGGAIPLTGSSGVVGTSVRDLTAVGNLVFFTADDGSGNSSLWKTDGTPSGTVMVADFPTVAVGPYDAFRQFTAAGDDLFFLGPSSLSTTTSSLWVSDGTATGTQPLATPSFVESMIGFGSDLLFSANGQALWISDGTPSGTAVLKDIIAGTGESDPNSFVLVGKEAFFLAASGLWKTDGTAVGTAEVYDFGSRPPFNLSAVGSVLYLATGDYYSGPSTYQVWTTDPMSGQTRPLANVLMTLSTGEPAFVAAGNDAVFAASDGLHGLEPWASDGTPTGTHLLLDINTAPAGSSPQEFTPFGGAMFFVASDEVHGTRLWKTDGAPDGTVPALDSSAFGGIGPGELAEANGALYFTGSSPSGNGLWKTDGTTAGTMMVNGAGANAYSGAQDLISADGTLYFLGLNNLTRTELIRTDGTTAGTKALFTLPDYPAPAHLINVNGQILIEDYAGLYAMNASASGYTKLGPSTGYSFATYYPEFVANGILYYLANDSAGLDLLRSDGTVAGTYEIAPITGAHLPFRSVSLFAALGNDIYFIVSDGGNDQLWTSDGTAAGTRLIATAASIYPQLMSVGGALYYFVQDAVIGTGLWKTDGSSAGALFVPDLQPPDEPVLGGNRFTTLGNLLFFTATEPTHGMELWETDGTPSGTQLVQDINPGPQSSEPLNLTPFQNRIYFAANDGLHGQEPWVLDSSGSITGSAFNDASNTGVESPGDPPMAGITVYIDANNDGVLDPGDPTATTDANGNYTFSDSQPGSYTVRENLPSGWRRTTPIDSQLIVRVLFGGTAAGPTFGNVQISTVSLGFDYLITVARHYGQAGTFATGDLSGDGKVDFADLVLLARNYGHPLAGSAAAMLAASLATGAAMSPSPGETNYFESSRASSLPS